jgi:hypothetical protein
MSGRALGWTKAELETRRAEISRVKALSPRLAERASPPPEQGAQRTDATAEGTNNTSAEDESSRCDTSEPEDWIVASHTVTLWTRAKLVQFHHRHLGWMDTAECSDKLRQATVSTSTVSF